MLVRERGGVAELLAEVREHGLDDARIARRGGVVVEVDGKRERHRSGRFKFFLVSGLVSGFWFLVSVLVSVLVSGFWFLVCPRRSLLPRSKPETRNQKPET